LLPCALTAAGARTAHPLGKELCLSAGGGGLLLCLFKAPFAQLEQLYKINSCPERIFA